MTTTRANGFHVALLRGVNVGGNHILPMKDLVALFEDAGCTAVRTYIQSGNVVYAADAALARRVGPLVTRAIAARFGFDTPVVTRTAAELAAVARRHPFAKPGLDPKMLHVGFLLDLPSPARVAALDPKRSPQDRFVVRGREVYLCYGRGAGNTKLTSQYFDTTLGTTITARNWNTVQKLLELAGGG